MAKSQTTHVIEIEAGIGEPSFIPLTLGKELDPISLGKKGMWRIESPRVLDVHAFVYFDGTALFLQSAEDGATLAVDGQPVGKAWTELTAPCQIEIGAARLRFRSLLAPAREPRPAPRTPPPPPIVKVGKESMPSSFPKAERPFAPGELANRQEPAEDTRVKPFDVTTGARAPRADEMEIPRFAKTAGMPAAPVDIQRLAPSRRSTGPLPPPEPMLTGPIAPPGHAMMVTGPMMPPSLAPASGVPGSGVPGSFPSGAIPVGTMAMGSVPPGMTPLGPGVAPLGPGSLPPGMGSLPPGMGSVPPSMVSGGYGHVAQVTGPHVPPGYAYAPMTGPPPPVAPPAEPGVLAKYKELSGPKKILVVLAPFCLLASAYLILFDEEPAPAPKVAAADAGVADARVAAATVTPPAAACPPGFVPWPVAINGTIPCVPAGTPMPGPTGGPATAATNAPTASTAVGVRPPPSTNPRPTAETPEPAPTPMPANGPKTLERQAVDAVAMNDYPRAAKLYEALQQQNPTNRVYAEAARILRAKADAGAP